MLLLSLYSQINMLFNILLKKLNSNIKASLALNYDLRSTQCLMQYIIRKVCVIFFFSNSQIKLAVALFHKDHLECIWSLQNDLDTL